MPPLQLALMMVVGIEAISLIGLLLARRFLVPRLRYHEGVNDAVSGTVQAIGVFYGITVGLIAVGVWNTNSNAYDLVSKEAASIGGLYRDTSGYPAQVRDELQSKLRAYTHAVIEQVWPEQKRGHIINVGTLVLNDFQTTLFKFEPSTPGQTSLHDETLRAFNTLIVARRMRIDAVGSGLSKVMWMVIWVGAAISIGVAYLYKIEDARIHAMLVALMAGFLAMVIFMIWINDKPFFGYVSIPADSYQLVLDKLIEVPK